MIDQILKRLQIVSDEEAEKAEYVVCAPAGTQTPFSDNLTGFCSHCGCKIIYRWHAPRRPKRICLDCLIKKGLENQRESGADGSEVP